LENLKISLRRSRHRWESDIKVDFKEIEFEDVNSIHLVVDCGEHVIGILHPRKGGEFLE
jgi:hypothetical protein